MFSPAAGLAVGGLPLPAAGGRPPPQPAHQVPLRRGLPPAAHLPYTHPQPSPQQQQQQQQPGAVVGEAATGAHSAAGLGGEVTSEVTGGAAEVSRNISKYATL